MSHLDLRGRRFPLWTFEPGVDRDKSSCLTFRADQPGRAGGDYYATNYPQPTFLSSRCYALHVETTACAVFDLRHDKFREIEVWAIPERIEPFARGDLIALVTAMADRFLRQPRLPDWVLDGAIIGLKDGMRSFERLEAYLAAGAAVSGLRCEDWAGLRGTSFGRRLFWNWQASGQRYPGLKAAHRRPARTRHPLLGLCRPLPLQGRPAVRRDRRARPLRDHRRRKDPSGRLRRVRLRRVRLRRGRLHQQGAPRAGLRTGSSARTCWISACPAGWPTSASTCRSTSS